jgi:hypothetical protein
MSVDFAALALAVVSGVPDVRACLIVSRDGLALGAHPASEEEKALTVWTRVAALGEVERGFVALRDEVWAFCRRGPYAALATGHPSTRAGILLDALEQMLLAAEEARVRKEALKPALDREPAVGDPSRGPRTPLHAGAREEAPELAPVESSPKSSLEGSQVSAWVERLRAQAIQSEAQAAVASAAEMLTAPENADAEPEAAAAEAPESALVEVRTEPDAPDEPEPPREEPPEEQASPRSNWVDTASLRREFAGLFSEEKEER